MLQFPYAGLTTPMFDMYPPFMVSAVWGLDNCIGVEDASPEWAQQNGCVAVQEDTDGDGIGDGELITRVVPRDRMRALFLVGDGRPGAEEDAQYPLDAVAVGFSWSVEQDSLQWSDFQVTLADGRVVKPDLVTVAPDRDPNERATITMYGQFADHSAGDNNRWVGGELLTPGMVSVEVVDDLIVTNGTHRFNVKGARFVGGNLEYEKGAVLVMGLLRPYAQNLNPVNEGVNSCRRMYDGITHVLQASTNGGVTKDGVNPFNDDQVNLYAVTLKSGGELRRDAFVGLADIDGDDFTDICLRLNPGEADNLDKLVMRCDPNNPLERWALPHGDINGFSPCTDTQPQPIAHLRCPDAIQCR